MIFSQRNHLCVVTIPDADFCPGTSYSDIVSLKNYNHVTFYYIKGSQDGTTSSTLTVQACTTITATATDAIPFRYKKVADFTLTTGSDVPGVLTDATLAGVASAATANSMVIIEVDAAALTDGYPFCRLKMVETGDNPADGCVIAILSEPRFTDDTPISALA